MNILTNNVTLLLVENDPNTTELIKTILFDKVDTFVTAQDGEEGLKQYLQHNPQIIISSLTLPEISGIDMCKNIVKHNEHAQVMLIVNDEDSTELINAIRLGLNNFIFKPLEKNIILKKIEKMIQTLNYEQIIDEQNSKITQYLDFIEKKLCNKNSGDEKDQHDNLHTEYEKIAAIGSWRHDLNSNSFFWSKEIFNILEIDSNSTKPSYEKFLTLIIPEDREKINLVHKTTLTKDEIFDTNFSITLKDGSSKFLNEKCRTVFDEKDKPIYTIGTIQDISQYKQLHDNLSKTEKIMIAQSKYATMGEILTMIMHQWRQPITTISMTANNLLVDLELEELENDTVHKSANTITEQTHYLSKTIDDFRSFFKNVKLPEETLMKDVFEETTNIMIHSLTNSEIELKLNFDDNISINTYKRELLQVLINIIKNAKDALVEKIETNRFIEVVIKEKDETIEISILDNAEGIPETILSKIFEPYFTTKDENTGTGLGLYMSKKIIEDNLNGKLSANNIDNGACFNIVLPKKITI